MARKRTPVVPKSARPELLSLLQACKEQPDDDAPRLVLADWLEEHGGEAERARAEFVRLQLARAKLTDDDPRHDASLTRERELLRDYGDAWLGPLGSLVEPRRRQDVYLHRRGLLHLEAGAAALAKEAALAESEAWAWVYSLDISAPGVAPLRELARSPLLAGLSELTVSHGVTRGGWPSCSRRRAWPASARCRCKAGARSRPPSSPPPPRWRGCARSTSRTTPSATRARNSWWGPPCPTSARSPSTVATSAPAVPRRWARRRCWRA